MAEPADAIKMARIDAGDGDVAMLNGLLRRGVRVGNENPDGDDHLHQLIPKPWGREYRAYADDFLDIWHLQIDAGHATSMHAHPRKTTYLLCLAGEGTMTTLTGTVPVRAGTVLRIGRGAFHSTSSESPEGPLMLVEVETPRNKYDLLRLRDGYQRAGTGYELAATELRTKPRKVPYMGNASLCRTSPCGNYSFNICAGMDIHYRRRELGVFLIPLGIRELLTDRMTILTDHPEDHRRPSLDNYYLGIRRAA
jgi:mannose-6-phosphate isomerase-like protein (cupin superfamily)